MLKQFQNCLTRGDVVVVAVGLVVALAFSGLIHAFTTSVINPVIARAEGAHALGLGWPLGARGHRATFVDIGAFISAVIYFIIFLAVVYFAIVVPYKVVMARRGETVFGDPAPTQTCPACLSSDLPLGATKCKYCGTDQPPSPSTDAAAASGA